MKIDQLDNYPKKIVVYGGRFQPMHRGHFAVYRNLIEHFGPNNVFVSSSNKVSEKSPMTFAERKLFATTAFPIPENKFVYTKIPYKPDEILERYNPERDILIIVVSEKDADRFMGDYFLRYNESETLRPFAANGYVLVVPIEANGINATKIRNYFKSNKSLQDKKEFFKKVYKNFNRTAFSILNKFLSR